MKKKKIMIISVLIILCLAGLGIGYYVLNKPNKETTLTIVENKWIENNKNKRIDLSIINEVPILNYNGKGLAFEFLSALEKDTGLEFIKTSISKDEKPKTEYAITVTDKVGKNELLLYQDNYAIVTQDNIKYNRLEDIKDITLGVLKTDLESINKYLRGSTITLKTYEKESDLLTALKNKENDGINAIAIPKTMYLKDIIENDLTIAYNISEHQVNYVFRLGKTDRLNTILKKYYQKWYETDYQKTYQHFLANAYFEFKNIGDKEKTKFKSKRYVYGFVENAPYDIMIGSKLKGYNSLFLKNFSDLSDVEISFQEYRSISEMVKAFNENKVDIILENYENAKYNLDVANTISPYNEQLVILSHGSEKNVVNSIASLERKKVSVIKNSMIGFYLKANNIKTQEFDSMEKLLKKLEKNSIIALDYENYKYYNRSELKNYKVDYIENLADEYYFTMRDIKDNRLFIDLFSFYLSFENEKSVLNNNLYELSKMTKTEPQKMQWILLIGSVLLIVVALIGYIKIAHHKGKNKTISKEDKLRYIDSLTSLKNRAYLNDNIEKWDSSEIYPQAIIIIDLNNIAYINDNYGHQEGDNVIKEAANILIRGQIQNSDIIRTNGNEFLIYLVGYDEKQVVAYNRKLGKELRELSHGFGAASGYSMINDAIKTIDDAVNEATLDMRNNKEELNN